MTKLPSRYVTVVMPFFLSILMSCIISGVSTIKAIGLPPDFILSWMKAWGISWVIAFPTVMLVLPIVRRLTAMVVDTAPKN